MATSSSFVTVQPPTIANVVTVVVIVCGFVWQQATFQAKIEFWQGRAEEERSRVYAEISELQQAVTNRDRDQDVVTAEVVRRVNDHATQNAVINTRLERMQLDIDNILMEVNNIKALFNTP